MANESGELNRADLSEAHPKSIDKLREIVTNELGRDALENAEGSSASIDIAIKYQLLALKETNPADVERMLGLWREFSNYLFGRISGENTKNPQKVEEALKQAIEIMKIH